MANSSLLNVGKILLCGGLCLGSAIAAADPTTTNPPPPSIAPDNGTGADAAAGRDAGPGQRPTSFSDRDHPQNKNDLNRQEERIKQERARMHGQEDRLKAEAGRMRHQEERIRADKSGMQQQPAKPAGQPGAHQGNGAAGVRPKAGTPGHGPIGGADVGGGK